jgi:hypothetical protein
MEPSHYSSASSKYCSLGCICVSFIFKAVPQSIIRIIKSRRMRWAGHVARMGRRGMRIDY